VRWGILGCGDVTEVKSGPGFRDAAGTQEIDVPYPRTVAQPFIQSIVDDLLGRGSCPSTGVSARRTSRVMDQVLERYYGGRGDAFWTRPQS
jgi:hypothetical protein